MNSYRIDRGLVYQQPPHVSLSKAPVEIMLQLCIVKTREERRKASEEAAITVKREMLTRKGGYLNIETMTGRGKELADLMERRNADILCRQEAKWKGS